MPQILYVESSVTAQALMRKFLKDLCDLTIAKSVPDAKALLAQKSFELVITDFLFPSGDALDFIKWLRKREATRSVPIIVVSSSMDRVVLSRVIRAGANDGLGKPLDVPSFRTLITRMLAQPFVREIKDRVHRVCCFQWCADDRYFEFCPDLDLTVSGATQAEAAQRMEDALRSAEVRRESLGGTTQESVVTHIVPH